MITLCWEAEKITITKEELTLLTRHVRVPQTLKGNNMWKLIDCGSYPWFIKKSQKFYHCVYGLDGEYKKIKIHQLGLFKQRIRAKIKDICPGATPASVVEVREFNNKIKGLIEKRKSTNEVVDVGNTIPAAAITTKSKPTKQEPEAVKGPSENLKKMVREDPVGTKQLVDTKTEEAKKVVEDTAVEQLDEGDDTTIEQITETVPKEEEKQKTWSAFTFAIIKADTLNDGGESNSSNVETILNKSVPNIVSEFKNNIDNNRKWTTESETLFSDSRVQHSDKLSVGDFIASSTVRLLSYDTNRATGLKQVALSYTYKLQRKTNRFPSVVTSIAETVNGMGSNYAEANNNAFVHIENLTRRHVKKATTAV